MGEQQAIIKAEAEKKKVASALKCEQRNVRLENKKKVLEVKAMEKQVARVLTPLGYCGSNNSKKNNVTYRRLAMFHQQNKCCFQGTDFEHAFSDEEEKKMTEQKSAAAGRSQKNNNKKK